MGHDFSRSLSVGGGVQELERSCYAIILRGRGFGLDRVTLQANPIGAEVLLSGDARRSRGAAEFWGRLL